MAREKETYKIHDFKTPLIPPCLKYAQLVAPLTSDPHQDCSKLPGSPLKFRNPKPKSHLMAIWIQYLLAYLMHTICEVQWIQSCLSVSQSFLHSVCLSYHWHCYSFWRRTHFFIFGPKGHTIGPQSGFLLFSYITMNSVFILFMWGSMDSALSVSQSCLSYN